MCPKKRCKPQVFKHRKLWYSLQRTLNSWHDDCESFHKDSFFKDSLNVWHEKRRYVGGWCRADVKNGQGLSVYAQCSSAGSFAVFLLLSFSLLSNTDMWYIWWHTIYSQRQKRVRNVEKSLKNGTKFSQIPSIIHIFQQIYPEGSSTLRPLVKILAFGKNETLFFSPLQMTKQIKKLWLQTFIFNPPPLC